MLSRSRPPLAAAACVLAFAFIACASAAVRVASPFTDHMVLQRDLPVPVWGTADPGEKITVVFASQQKSTIASPDGRWRLDLDPLPASAEPRDLLVTSASDEPKSHISNLTFSDVLVGEVWLCSGQSNMVFTLSKARYPWAGVVDEEKEIAAADHPLIRMFTADAAKAYEPQPFVGGTWQVCTPQTAPDFSAIGYYFARALQSELNVPVGIITAAYGASCAHAWIRRDAMLDDPRFKAVLDRFDDQVKHHVPPTEAELHDWQLAVEQAKAEHKRPPRRPGADPVQDQHNPTVMFNGMIAPLVPFAIRGVLWYQGESITAPRELFPAWNERLITDWRSLWRRDSSTAATVPLPFYFVQLAALGNASNSPQVRAWQAEALKLPHTGMAVTIDVGDPKDVHPHHKAPVGDRLARLALAHTYGRAVEASGPQLATASVEGSSLRLRFSPTTGGLVARGGPLQTFELAGADGQWHPAEAVIDRDTILVRSSAVPAPVAARYAWSNYPAGCNLFNPAGLPAAPFQTSR